MSDDIVERLRTRNGRADGFGLGPVCDEAADEITRLRAALAAAQPPAAMPVPPSECDSPRLCTQFGSCCLQRHTLKKCATWPPAAAPAAQPVPATGAQPEARTRYEWHDDDGCVQWWAFPISEPPYVGSPLCDNWPGYHTHWTPIVCPTAPTGSAAE